MNTSSSSASGGGHKASMETLSVGGGGIDFVGSQFNVGETISSMGGGRPSGFSPSHGTSFVPGASMPMTASSAATAAASGGNIGGSYLANPTSNCQWGTRGIIEYLIRIVLNTLETQVHICKERAEDDVFDSPSLYLPRLRGMGINSSCRFILMLFNWR